MTAIQSFGFVEGDTVYVKNSEGIYECTTVDLGETGVYLTRAGIGRTFIPWSDVIRVYQTESAAVTQEQMGPNVPPA